MKMYSWTVNDIGVHLDKKTISLVFGLPWQNCYTARLDVAAAKQLAEKILLTVKFSDID